MGKSLPYREVMEMCWESLSLHFILEVGNAGRQHGQS